MEKYFIDVTSELANRYPYVDIDIVTNSDRFSERLLVVLSAFYFKRLKKSDLYKCTYDQICQRLSERVTYRKSPSLFKLRSILRSYDVVYSKNEILDALILRIFVGKGIRSLIYGCHTALAYPEGMSIQSRIHNFLYLGRFYKMLTKNATLVHVMNMADVRLLKNFGKKVYYIPYPFDVEAYKKMPLALPREQTAETSGDDYTIVWIGRLTEQKGVAELLHLIETTRKGLLPKRVRWKIYGDGCLKRYVEMISESGDDVEYFGWVSSADIATALACADLFVSTSKWETFGYTIIEAISLSIPVISFDIPGPQDIIIDGVNGFLVNDVDDFCTKIFQLVRGFSPSQPGSGLSPFLPDVIYPQLEGMIREVAGYS